MEGPPLLSTRSPAGIVPDGVGADRGDFCGGEMWTSEENFLIFWIYYYPGNFFLFFKFFKFLGIFSEKFFSLIFTNFPRYPGN